MPFASVWRAAKPMTRPSTAEDARRPVAILLASGIFRAAMNTPISTIPRKTSRRMRRRRVWADGDSSPRVTSSPTFLPRLAIARSTIWAMTNAITIAMPAPIQSSLDAAV